MHRATRSTQKIELQCGESEVRRIVEVFDNKTNNLVGHLEATAERKTHTDEDFIKDVTEHAQKGLFILELAVDAALGLGLNKVLEEKLRNNELPPSNE